MQKINQKYISYIVQKALEEGKQLSPALIKDPGDFDSIYVVMPMKG